MMKADEETCFKVCFGYIFSGVLRYLQDQGFHVEKVDVTGELQGGT